MSETVEELRRQVDALEEANRGLASDAFARGDAGGAAAIVRLTTQIAVLEENLQAREARIAELTEVAELNDRLYQQQLAWNDTRRYRIADAVHRGLTRLRPR